MVVKNELVLGLSEAQVSPRSPLHNSTFTFYIQWRKTNQPYLARQSSGNMSFRSTNQSRLLLRPCIQLRTSFIFLPELFFSCRDYIRQYNGDPGSETRPLLTPNPDPEPRSII